MLSLVHHLLASSSFSVRQEQQPPLTSGPPCLPLPQAGLVASPLGMAASSFSGVCLNVTSTGAFLEPTWKQSSFPLTFCHVILFAFLSHRTSKFINVNVPSTYLPDYKPMRADLFMAVSKLPEPYRAQTSTCFEWMTQESFLSSSPWGKGGWGSRPRENWNNLGRGEHAAKSDSPAERVLQAGGDKWTIGARPQKVQRKGDKECYRVPAGGKGPGLSEDLYCY